MSKYIDYQFVKSKQDFQQVNDRILQSLPRQAQRYRQELDRGELTKIQLQQEITKLNKQIEQQNQESLQKLKSKIQNLQEQINDSKQEQKEIISQSEKQKQFLEIQIQGFEKIITQKNKNNDLNNTNKNTNNLNNNNNPQQQNQSFQSKQQLLTNVISKTSSLNNTSTTTSTNTTSTPSSTTTKTATKTNVPINKTTNSQLQPSIKKILKTTVELKSEKKSFGRYKWNKRFFELDNGILAIYDKENGSCELKIDIKEDGRSIKKKVEQKKKCCIEIRTSDSTFLFSLENLEEQTTWYRSFREARF
ncbi:metabotropic glutamate receptor-like protein p [Anaeramoeba flamelloides]|uniref:Metabotropic glutamate receptor-like protein p n=1 Tax=Anaeramoeba flamelloides TaxID=1746091 RepID=A0AAV7ZKZ4_9EUKA|nr:metabotropic glutamate receptor-like protein p [Anaeramoeba flamelloides]